VRETVRGRGTRILVARTRVVYVHICWSEHATVPPVHTLQTTVPVSLCIGTEELLALQLRSNRRQGSLMTGRCFWAVFGVLRRPLSDSFAGDKQAMRRATPTVTLTRVRSRDAGALEYWRKETSNRICLPHHVASTSLPERV